MRFFDHVNKKGIGKMKDEFKGKITIKFVVLKSKMCSLVNVDGEENKKSKTSQLGYCLGHKSLLMFYLAGE